MTRAAESRRNKRFFPSGQNRIARLLMCTICPILWVLWYTFFMPGTARGIFTAARHAAPPPRVGCDFVFPTRLFFSAWRTCGLLLKVSFSHLIDHLISIRSFQTLNGTLLLSAYLPPRSQKFTQEHIDQEAGWPLFLHSDRPFQLHISPNITGHINKKCSTFILILKITYAIVSDLNVRWGFRYM